MIQLVKKIINKVVTKKSLAIALTLLYVGSIIPLLIIAKYNVPSADDFSIGMTCRMAWRETHSIFSVIWQALLMAWNDYWHWMGYYTSIFLMSIHPGVFGEKIYATTTWLMLASISFGTIYFFKALFVKLFKMDKYICHSISMITLFVTVQCIIGRNEAFYWYCGAVNYSFIHGLELFYWGAVISLICDQSKKKRTFDMVIACILGFLVGGGNYMSALNMCIIIVVVMILLLISHTFKENKRIILPFAIAILGFLLSCFAPGNSVRSAKAVGMNPIKAIFVSLFYCLDYCLGEWTNWVVLLMILVCVVLFWNGLSKTEFKFPYPILFVLFSYGVVSAMITPPLFAVNNIEAGRLKALIYMMYILILVIDIGYVVGWTRCHFKVKKAQGEVDFTVNSKWLILLSVGFFAFGSVLCVIPNHYFYTCTSAVTDLTNGSAKAFGDAMEERFKLLNNDNLKDVVLDELPAKPELLFYSDIEEDPEYWENRLLSKGYQKNSVVLRKRQE